MDRIVVRILPEKRGKIALIAYPHLHSSNRHVQKGIDLLHKHTPKILHFLSRQRTYSHFQDCQVVVLAPADLEDGEVRHLLQKWLGRKRARRIAYILVEIALLPPALMFGLLPGPNIIFYSIFILLYFHLKAFISLGRVRMDKLELEINRECMK